MYKACANCGKIHTFENPRCRLGKRYHHDCSSVSKLRKSSKYQKIMNLVREDSNGLCSVCFDEGKFTFDDLEVHHIEKLKVRPDLARDFDNLICLCRFHHQLAEANILSKDYLYSLVTKRKENLKKFKAPHTKLELVPTTKRSNRA